MARRNEPVGSPRRQGGVALIAMLTLLSLFGLYLFVGQLSATPFQRAREENEAATLAEARQALIGDAVSRLLLDDAGHLRLPDRGAVVGEVPDIDDEGRASGNFAGNNKDLSVVGRFPWKTLDTGPLRDGAQECLWYVVSGRFKIVPKTDALNWDTVGQIDVINANGSFIATNLAALIVAPGTALDAQSRVLANVFYRECGGNYDTRNYLDSYDSARAVTGQVNYFAGSTNSRVASTSSNKQFVLVDSSYYNDRFVFITVDQIFDPLIRRSDFAAAIGNLLDDVAFREHLRTMVLAGSKGTDNLVCMSATGADNQEFCKNWKEMLFLTELPMPSKIMIGGALSAVDCNRVLIFSGRRTAGQSRVNLAEKANPLNYLENPNASSFSVPTASSTGFAGNSVFDWRNPSADIVRCLA